MTMMQSTKLEGTAQDDSALIAADRYLLPQTLKDRTAWRVMPQSYTDRP